MIPPEGLRRRSLAAVPALALAALLAAVAGCRGDAADPTPVDRPPTLEPTAAALDDAAAAPASEPTLIAAGPPVALSVRAMSPVRRPDRGPADLRPGRWSPDGDALVAWEVVDPASPAPVGRAWLVTAPRDGGASGAPLPSAIWDSGDVEGPLDAGIDRLAVWLAGGTLAVARSDEMLIARDGQPAEPVVGLGERQLRGLEVAPDGARLVAYGPDGAWIVAEDGLAAPLAGAPESGAERWAWRADGGALAASRDSEILVADVIAGGPLEVVARVDATGEGEDDPFDAGTAASGDGAAPEPRWLADGTLFLGAPSPLAGDREGYAYRAIAPDGAAAMALPMELGLDPMPVPVDGAASWVSPGGHAILVPEVVAGPDGPAVRASWLYDVATRGGRELPPMVDAVWSPDGARLAWVEAGVLLARHVPTGRVAVLAPTGAAGGGRLTWSPDGRWLLYAGAFGDLWLARADATSGTVRVADSVAWEPVGPTWAPGSDRFAVTVRDSDGTTRLVVADLPAR